MTVRVAIVVMVSVSGCLASARTSEPPDDYRPQLVAEEAIEIFGDLRGFYGGKELRSHYPRRGWLVGKKHRLVLRAGEPPVIDSAAVFPVVDAPVVVAGRRGDDIRVVHERAGVRLYLWFKPEDFHAALVESARFPSGSGGDVFVKLQPGYRVSLDANDIVSSPVESFQIAASLGAVEYGHVFTSSGSAALLPSSQTGRQVDSETAVNGLWLLAAPRPNARRMGRFAEKDLFARFLAERPNGAVKVHYKTSSVEAVGYVFEQAVEVSDAGIGTTELSMGMGQMVPPGTCLWHNGRAVGVFYGDFVHPVSRTDQGRIYIDFDGPLTSLNLYAQMSGTQKLGCDGKPVPRAQVPAEPILFQF